MGSFMWMLSLIITATASFPSGPLLSHCHVNGGGAIGLAAWSMGGQKPFGIWFTYIIMLVDIALLLFTWLLAFEATRKYITVIAKDYQAGLKLLWIAMASFFGMCFLCYTIGTGGNGGHVSMIGEFFTSADTYMMLIYGAGYYLAYRFFEEEKETEVCNAV